MQHKITLPQLKKYDITQKVIEALADAESRALKFVSDQIKNRLATFFSKNLETFNN